MSWSLLESFNYTHEAHLASHKLEASGIRARVSTLRAGLAGMVPIKDAVSEVWVHKEELDAARRVLNLELLDGGQEAREEPEVCPKCGAAWEPGFEACWSCSVPM